MVDGPEDQGRIVESFQNQEERGGLYLQESIERDLLLKGGPEQVRAAVRSRMATIEDQFTIQETTRVNTYAEETMLRDIEARRRVLAYWGPLGLLDMSKDIRFSGTNQPETVEERDKLINSLSQASQELTARLHLVSKVEEQLTWQGDIEDYLFKYFLRSGKAVLPARDYGTLLNLPPTYESFVPLGHKMETAFKVFKMIAEGRATVTLDNGAIKRLPNIFAMTANRGLLNFAIERVVVPELRKMRPQTDRVADALAEYEDEDDRSAALLGLMFFRHADFDAQAALDLKGKTNLNELSADELKQISLGIGPFTNDSAKAVFFEVRRLSEFGQKEPREHLRVAGNPMSLECYPSMNVNMLQAVSTEMAVTPEMGQQILAGVPRGAALKNDRVAKKISLSIYDRCFTNKITVMVEVVDSSGEEKKIPVEVGYQPVNLRDIKWDGFEVLNTETDDEVVEFALGPQTDTYETYKVLGFVYFKAFVEQMMRIDFNKQFEEAMAGDLLRKMNKTIDNSLSMLGSAHNISEGTIKKLNDYVRVVFIGTLVAAVSQDVRDGVESGQQVNPNADQVMARRDAFDRLLPAVTNHGFLPTNRDPRKVVELKKRFKSAVEQIAVMRRAPKPGNFRMDGKSFFSEEELEELKPLYPLGLKT